MAATAILQALSGPLRGRLLASLPALPQPVHHRHARHCSWCDCCRQALSLPAPALLKGAVGHTTLTLADVSHVATNSMQGDLTVLLQASLAQSGTVWWTGITSSTVRRSWPSSMMHVPSSCQQAGQRLAPGLQLPRHRKPDITACAAICSNVVQPNR